MERILARQVVPKIQAESESTAKAMRRADVVGQFPKLSSHLAEVVLDSALWPQLMDEVCLAVGAVGAVMVEPRGRTRDLRFTESVGEIFQFYFQNGWHERDIRARGTALMLKGRAVVTDEDVVSAEEMRSAPYYTEFLRPLNLQWFAGVAFRADQTLWALRIQRTARQGPFLAREKCLLAGLSPLLTEAATLSSVIGRAALRSATGALDSVGKAAIAIDRFGSVVEVNHAAEAIFDDEISIRHGHLLLSDAKARHCLQDLIQLLMTEPHATAPAGPMVVPRSGKQPIAIQQLPVPPVAQNLFSSARAILTLVPLEPGRPPNPVLLSQAFNLTPAEARLAARLADGTSLEHVAEALNVSLQTARTQLKMVFTKTGTHRQSELVALLSRI